MVVRILFVGIAFVSLACAHQDFRQKHPDVGLNVKRLIRKYGYPLEKHTVTTEDGYILEVHRIPYGRNDTATANKPPALIVPGMLCSSADWVNMGPEKSLGFILADKGYDVWLANYRGTTWSRKHVSLDPDKDINKFWNYSFHEIGNYDASAIIDHILNVTNQENLFYIGHSQGTTSVFALASEKPEYNNKIRLAIALAPVVYAEHSKSSFLYLLAVLDVQMEAFREKYQFYEVLPHYRLFTVVGQIFCNDDSPFQIICASIFYIAGGYSPDQMNKARSNSLIGEEENLIKYGSPTPPKYNISKITAPVALYHGEKDLWSAAKDIDRLASELPNVVVQHLIKGFNHLDYLWGIDSVKLLYNNLLDLMEQH